MPSRTSGMHLAPARGVVAAWALGLSVLGAALGADAQRDDALEIRDVVQAQMQAFSLDDAQKAFALADAGVRTRFETPERFMAMVRAHYPMMLKPVSVLFLKPHSAASAVFQRVRVVDQEGNGWMVTYLLQQQRDRQWRISACVAVPDGPAVTA